MIRPSPGRGGHRRRPRRDPGRRRVDEVAGVVAELGPVDAGPAVAERGVAPTQRLAQPVLGGRAAERRRPTRRGGPRASISDGQPLHRAGAHQLEAEVDDPLVGGQQLAIDQRQAPARPSTSAARRSAGTALRARPICAASAPVTVSPVISRRFAHCGPTWYSHIWVGQRAEVAAGREPEAGVVGADHHVAQRREVGAAGQAVAVHLGDHRLVHVEQHHAQPLGPLQLPGVVVERPAAARSPGRRAPLLQRGEVVAGAERPTGAGAARRSARTCRRRRPTARRAARAASSAEIALSFSGRLSVIRATPSAASKRMVSNVLATRSPLVVGPRRRYAITLPPHEESNHSSTLPGEVIIGLRRRGCWDPPVDRCRVPADSLPRCPRASPSACPVTRRR